MRILLASMLALVLCAAAEAPGIEYFNDFEKAEPGSVPTELMVFPGDAKFAVEQEPGNRFLRVKPTPVDGFGVLFGADDAATTAVEARIRTTSLKKRFPEFGVGLGGSSAYRLWLMPATGELQLLKGEEVMASKPYEWKSGTWTRFKFQLQPTTAGKSKLRGKVWPDGSPEPAEWMLTWEDTEKPMTGRASVGASPYPETPVDFDDIKSGTAK
ncbi:MAG: hypothetical protein ABSH20_09160 [Tepidisphaeraceae bacterium]|jgi:hypothetical protein